MRVAVFVETAPTDGGAFQQALSMVELLLRSNAGGHEFVVFTPLRQTRDVLQSRLGVTAVCFGNRIIRHVDLLACTWAGEALFRRLRRLGLRRIGRHLDALLDSHRIDIALFTDVTATTMRIGDHPLITTVMDLDHVDHPDYPEHFRHREFEQRERILRNALPRSLAVIANSATGAQRIADLYRVDPARLLCLPFVPSNAVRQQAMQPAATAVAAIRQKYDLPAQYLFYPAYYLAHKNHWYVLEALAALKRSTGVALQAVFCGADRHGELALLQRHAAALGVANEVRFLGFVPDAEIPPLYAGAFAVVCPSPFGPTNLQPIEAAAMGKPVICAELPGCREQMGGAALYCNLADPVSLADLLDRLLRDPALVTALRQAAERLTQTLGSIDYGARLAACLDRHAYLGRRWMWPDSPATRQVR